MTPDPDEPLDSGGTRKVRLWLVRVLFAGAASTQVIAGTVHLADGLALEGAFPASVYIQMNHPVAKQEYASAARSLQRCPSRDGDALVLAGEALARSGAKSESVQRLLRRGLTIAPASSRGWTLLAEQLESKNRRSAAEALSMSLSLAPRDYWLLGRNLVAAGKLWDVLPDDARQTAVGAVASLWRIEDLRVFIRPLLATPAGIAMVNSAMRSDSEEMRALNRWLASQTLREEQQSSPGRSLPPSVPR